MKRNSAKAEIGDAGIDNISLIDLVRAENIDEIKRKIEEDPQSVLEIDPESGVTALHIAGYQGLEEIAEAILQSNFIDFSIKDGRRNDVLRAAMASGIDEVIDLVGDAMIQRAPHLLNNPPDYDMNDFD